MASQEINILLGCLVFAVFSISMVTAGLWFHFGAHHSAFVAIKQAISTKQFSAFIKEELKEMAVFPLTCIVNGLCLFAISVVVFLGTLLPGDIYLEMGGVFLMALSILAIAGGLVFVYKKDTYGWPRISGYSAVMFGWFLVLCGFFLLLIAIVGLFKS